MKKIKFLIVCFLISFTCILFSCADKSSNETAKDNPTTSENDIVAGDTEPDNINDREAVGDGLPDIDFDGYIFRIITREDFIDSIVAYEQNADVINDAFYRANIAVEDRFNVKIQAIGNPDPAGAASKFIKSNDDAFDLVFEFGDASIVAPMLQGCFINLYSLNHLDFNKPWWPKNTVDSLTFNGKMYMYSNSMTTLGMDWTRALFINKGMAADMGVTVPYQDVFDGTWTLDKMTKLTKDIYRDVNGNGEKDGEDLYGYVFTGRYFCSIEPFGIQIVKKTGNTLELDVLSERTIKAVDMMYDLMIESKGTYYNNEHDTISVDMFSNGQCLIAYSQLGMARSHLRFSDVDYGILPFPKLDETQETYYTGNHDRVFAVPTTAPNLDRTAVMIEAMSAEGWKKVFPAYYEIAMKNKYLSDEESIKILDLLYSTRVLDFTYVYGIYKFNLMFDELFNTKNPSRDVVSYFEKNQNSVKKDLQKIEDKFNELD